METPPLRTLLVIVTFLGVFTILVASIPAEFLYATEEYRERDIPEEFEALELQQFVNTYNYTLISPSHFFKKNFGGHNFWHQSHAEYGSFYVKINHYDWEFPIFGFLIGSHALEWYGHETYKNYGKSIRGTEIEENWDSEDSVSHFIASCEHLQMYIWFSYNTTLYASVWEAYQVNGLQVLWAIEWDEMGTGLNAYNLIAMLLFWQLPDVHIVLNIILSIPLWVTIGWAMFAFIMAVIKSLPFT